MPDEIPRWISCVLAPVADELSNRPTPPPASGPFLARPSDLARLSDAHGTTNGTSFASNQSKPCARTPQSPLAVWNAGASQLKPRRFFLPFTQAMAARRRLTDPRLAPQRTMEATVYAPFRCASACPAYLRGQGGGFAGGYLPDRKRQDRKWNAFCADRCRGTQGAPLIMSTRALSSDSIIEPRPCPNTTP